MKKFLIVILVTITAILNPAKVLAADGWAIAAEALGVLAGKLDVFVFKDIPLLYICALKNMENISLLETLILALGLENSMVMMKNIKDGSLIWILARIRVAEPLYSMYLHKK